MNSSQSSQKQYGLVKTVKKTQPSTSKPSVFGDDPSSDEASAPAENWGNSALKAISHGSVQAAQTRQVIRQAMQEDPTLFQYDEVYEDMQQHKQKKAEAKQTEGQKPRYMAKLLDAAERRRHQQERRVERQVQRERQEEGDQFADKEQFVTSAYRERLLEREKEEEQERRTKRIEELTDVTKQKDLGSFYRHMYQQAASADQPPSPLGEVKTEPTDRLATMAPDPEGGLPQPHQQDSPRPVAPPTATGRPEQTRAAGRQYRRRRSSSSDVSPERGRSAADAMPADGRDPPQTAGRSRSPDWPTGRNRPHRQDRSHRRHRSRSGDQLHKRERSRSGDRSHRWERPRSRDRPHKRERSRSGDRSHKRERPRSGDRSHKRERSRSGDRSHKRERSRSGDRSRKRSRSRSGDRSHKRERSRSGDRSRKRSRSRSGDEQKAQPASGDGRTRVGCGRSTVRDSQRARASSPVRAVGTGTQQGDADAERQARRRALYEKRTVGAVFDAARERYLARRAAVLECTPLVASPA